MNLCRSRPLAAEIFPSGSMATGGSGRPMTTSEIPLTCPHCGKTMVKTVEWVQQNTFFTCQYCGAPAMIDKDHAAQFLAEIELRERR
jgi:predicted RNA-binding Zn-ribbon protein involved in translation (DUF1610 family)